MRAKLLFDGASKLEYEIRNIVKKAEQLSKMGQEIFWENIGDPIKKNAEVPVWIKDIVSELSLRNDSYGYAHSKGILETRKFLASRNNENPGAKITEDDILFFNGLGDAIAKVYQYLHPAARVIGPSPAYSTHSSAEAAHASKVPITYTLDPKNSWYPDLEELYLKVKYNPNIVGILVINPDNPTGMVYPLDMMERIVEIAKEFDLFIISDEIYNNITYNGAEAVALAQVIQDVPGIAMKGISKQIPWPGSRCGWMEFYNRKTDSQFDNLCGTLEDAKMIEVCSTTLPQMAIPKVLGDSRFAEYREDLNRKIGRRASIIAEIIEHNPYLTFNKTYGAFYNTIVFKEGALTDCQFIEIKDESKKDLLTQWLDADVALDKRFVYYLLASTGVCVVPLSSFHSELLGFRVTLLEENENMLQSIFTDINTSVIEYCESILEKTF